jgi:nucleotide-binding universal stress UspA family protein
MNAAEYAFNLAKNMKTQVTVVNIVDLSSIFKMLPLETKKQLIAIGRKEAHRMLEAAEELAKQHDLKIRTEVIESSVSVADAIIKYTKENNVDLIVAGTKGRTGMKKVVLGSVASKLVTYSPCSVLVVR